MATSTPNLGLKKFDGTDPFLRTDFNTNSDKIDAAPGAYLCTSTSRPTLGNYDGRLILETDTNLLYIYDSGTSTWVSPMHTLRAKQFVDATTKNIAAGQTTYSALPDSPALGTTFVAPASGKVLIQVSANWKVRSGSTYVTYQVKTGSTIGSGTLAGDGPNIFWGVGGDGSTNITSDIGSVSGGPVNLHESFTPGSTYNVSFVHYNSNNVLATIRYRSITIIPQP